MALTRDNPLKLDIDVLNVIPYQPANVTAHGDAYAANADDFHCQVELKLTASIPHADFATDGNANEGVFVDATHDDLLTKVFGGASRVDYIKLQVKELGGAVLKTCRLTVTDLAHKFLKLDYDLDFYKNYLITAEVQYNNDTNHVSGENGSHLGSVYLSRGAWVDSVRPEAKAVSNTVGNGEENGVLPELAAYQAAAVAAATGIAEKEEANRSDEEKALLLASEDATSRANYAKTVFVERVANGTHFSASATALHKVYFLRRYQPLPILNTIGKSAELDGTSANPYVTAYPNAAKIKVEKFQWDDALQHEKDELQGFKVTLNGYGWDILRDDDLTGLVTVADDHIDGNIPADIAAGKDGNTDFYIKNGDDNTKSTMTFVAGMKYYLPNSTGSNLGTDFYSGLFKDYLSVTPGIADAKTITDLEKDLVAVRKNGGLDYETQTFDDEGNIEGDALTMKSVKERNNIALNSMSDGSWVDTLASDSTDVFVDWSSVAKYRDEDTDGGKEFNKVDITSHIARANIRRYVSPEDTSELLKQAMRKNVSGSNELSDTFEFLISAAGSPNWYSTPEHGALEVALSNKTDIVTENVHRIKVQMKGGSLKHPSQEIHFQCPTPEVETQADAMKVVNSDGSLVATGSTEVNKGNWGFLINAYMPEDNKDNVAQEQKQIAIYAHKIADKFHFGGDEAKLPQNTADNRGKPGSLTLKDCLGNVVPKLDEYIHDLLDDDSNFIRVAALSSDKADTEFATTPGTWNAATSKGEYEVGGTGAAIDPDTGNPVPGITVDGFSGSLEKTDGSGDPVFTILSGKTPVAFFMIPISATVNTAVFKSLGEVSSYDTLENHKPIVLYPTEAHGKATVEIKTPTTWTDTLNGGFDAEVTFKGTKAASHHTYKTLWVQRKVIDSAGNVSDWQNHRRIDFNGSNEGSDDEDFGEFSGTLATEDDDSSLTYLFNFQVTESDVKSDLNSMDAHTAATIHDVYGAKYKIRVAADTTAENYTTGNSDGTGYIPNDSPLWIENTGYAAMITRSKSELSDNFNTNLILTYTKDDAANVIGNVGSLFEGIDPYAVDHEDIWDGGVSFRENGFTIDDTTHKRNYKISDADITKNALNSLEWKREDSEVVLMAGAPKADQSFTGGYAQMSTKHTPTREFEVKHPLLTGDEFKIEVSISANEQAIYSNKSYLEANMDEVITGHANQSLVNSSVAANQTGGNPFITHVHMDASGIVHKTDESKLKLLTTELNGTVGWKRVGVVSNSVNSAGATVYKTFFITIENAIGTQETLTIGNILYAIPSSLAEDLAGNHDIFVGSGKNGVMLTPSFSLTGAFDNQAPYPLTDDYSDLHASFMWKWNNDTSTASPTEWAAFKKLFNAITGTAGVHGISGDTRITYDNGNTYDLYRQAYFDFVVDSATQLSENDGDEYTFALSDNSTSADYSMFATQSKSREYVSGHAVTRVWGTSYTVELKCVDGNGTAFSNASMAIGGVNFHQLLDSSHDNSVLPTIVTVKAVKRDVSFNRNVFYNSVSLVNNTLAYNITAAAVESQVSITVGAPGQDIDGSVVKYTDGAKTARNTSTVIRADTPLSVLVSGFDDLSGSIDMTSDKLKINDDTYNTTKLSASPVNVERGNARQYYGATVNGHSVAADQLSGNKQFKYKISPANITTINTTLTWKTDTDVDEFDSEDLYNTSALEIAVAKFPMGTTNVLHSFLVDASGNDGDLLAALRSTYQNKFATAAVLFKTDSAFLTANSPNFSVNIHQHGSESADLCIEDTLSVVSGATRSGNKRAVSYNLVDKAFYQIAIRSVWTSNVVTSPMLDLTGLGLAKDIIFNKNGTSETPNAAFGSSSSALGNALGGDYIFNKNLVDSGNPAPALYHMANGKFRLCVNNPNMFNNGAASIVLITSDDNNPVENTSDLSITTYHLLYAGQAIKKDETTSTLAITKSDLEQISNMSSTTHDKVSWTSGGTALMNKFTNAPAFSASRAVYDCATDTSTLANKKLLFGYVQYSTFDTAGNNHAESNSISLFDIDGTPDLDGSEDDQGTINNISLHVVDGAKTNGTVSISL